MDLDGLTQTDPEPLFTTPPQEIISELEKKEEYQAEDVKIKKLPTNELNDIEYACEIKKPSIKFTGIINKKLQRNSIGLTKLINGDKYFGNYTKDMKDIYGIYIWNPKRIVNRIRTEYYWGTWKNNEKTGKGAYLWLSEKDNNKKPFSDFDSADFDFFIGDFKNNLMKQGAYLTKKGDQYFVYYGGFDEFGNKEGQNCYYYCAQNETILSGLMENNEFVSGHLCSFNEDGNVNEIIQCEFDDNHKISSFKDNEEFDNKIKEKLSKKFTAFRNSLLDKDYFGIIYQKFGKIVKDINDFDFNFLFTSAYSDLFIKIKGFDTLNILESIQKALK